ncbi:MAG: 1,4-alpha-glucan branching protein domain-containing protein [Promethearchaeota archaeon]
MTLGYFGLVLHGHMPWCKKSGTWPAGIQWYTEAALETYIPMLNVLRELRENKIKTAITINITPILAEMMADDYMKDRFFEYIDDLIRRAKSDIKRFENHPQRKEIAQFHLDNFERVLDTFYHNYYSDLLGSFKWLQDEGMIELNTCAATHGFLPLLKSDSGIFSQVQLAVDTHEKYFGQPPKGIWIPECAYRPKEYRDGKVREAIDYWLHNSGIEYFFVDSHGILDAEIIEQKNDIGLHTNFGYNLETGVSVFGRNKKSSRQVWDPRIGYPGDEYYREFHMKDHESGLHFWRITDKNFGKDKKELYDISRARERVISHANHFTTVLEEEIREFKEKHDKKGIIVSPYDFELYGHWWMEGIDWLKLVFENINKNPNVEMITFSDYIKEHKDDFSTIRMKQSSWGEGGQFQVWENQEHGWIWPYINGSMKELESVLDNRVISNDWQERLLKQAARELTLMLGSDWPFLLYTQQAKDYANQRFHLHHQRFNKLIWAARDPKDKNRLSLHELEQIEDIDSCFEHIKLDYFLRQI